ncbi:MAG: DUF512 domain-containing protein, partial [Selenomonas artemidis]
GDGAEVQRPLATVVIGGLLTGSDIVDALSRTDFSPDGVVIPASALREGEDVFLDDMSLADMRRLFSPIRIEPVATGTDYREALTDWKSYRRQRASGGYTWQSNAGYTKPVAGAGRA